MLRVPPSLRRDRLVHRPRRTAKARVLFSPVTPAPAGVPKETGGPPEFPDYPSERMPRSQIPVVSLPAGLGAGRTAAFQWMHLSALGPVVQPCPLSTIIHFSEFDYAACVLASPLLRTVLLSTRSSVRLPTGWLAVGRVGLEFPLTHWVTLTCFKRCLLYSHVPSLARREQMPGSASCHCPIRIWMTSPFLSGTGDM